MQAVGDRILDLEVLCWLQVSCFLLAAALPEPAACRGGQEKGFAPVYLACQQPYAPCEHWDCQEPCPKLQY